MKFQKINDNVIRCVLTSEEMRVKGINIEDLMGDRGKAEEFLQYVLNKARYEVDFVTNGDILNVQLSVMKDGGVSMMISDDQNAAIKAIAEQFREKLREFSKALETASGQKAPMAGQAIPGTKGSDIYNKEKVIKYFISNDDEGEEVTYSFWSRLASLDDCVRMAKALSEISESPADLYKYYGEYYFCIRLTMNKSQLAQNVFIMSEYSDDVSSENTDYLMVAEHGEILIKGSAIKTLNEVS